MGPGNFQGLWSMENQDIACLCVYGVYMEYELIYLGRVEVRSGVSGRYIRRSDLRGTTDPNHPDNCIYNLYHWLETCSLSSY